MSIVFVILAAMAGGSIAVVVTAAIAAGTQADAVQRAIRKAQNEIVELVQRVRDEKTEAARWRERALLCESHGPTVGDVDEVFRENARLKAELAILRGPKT